MLDLLLKILLFFFVLFLNQLRINGQVILSDKTDGLSQSDKVVYFQDKTASVTIDDLIQKDTFSYKTFQYKVASIPFTDGTYWLKFSIENKLNRPSSVILEVARSITNEVDFYLVKDDKVIRYNKCGDDTPFSERDIEHRKNLIQFGMQTDEKLNVFVKLRSDGELIYLPVSVYTPKRFYEIDSGNQLFQGAYFGILGVVIIIFFFFYQFLKDRIFLFYVLYITSIFLMQFSLEGFSYQFLFPNSPYFANHIILFSASITILFVMYFAYLYLNLTRYNYNFKKVYKYVMYASFATALLGLIPGYFYQYGYPFINVVGLIGVSTIVYSIFYLLSKGVKISRFFVTAFVILISGAIIFILTDLHIIKNAFLGDDALKLSSGIEAVILSISMAAKYKELASETEIAQAEKMKLMFENNQLVAQQKVTLEQEIKAQTKELNIERSLLEDKNRELTDSINYAKRIQDALIPPKSELKNCFDDSFVLMLPKDIVSGDFYWFSKVTTTTENPKKMSVVSVADCTGHGVPGAFMSIIGIKLFNESIKQPGVNSPSEALSFLDTQIFSTVNKHTKEGLIRDGMDLSLIAVNETDQELIYSGANNPIYIVPVNANSVDDLIELKADKHPIGSSQENKEFTNQTYKYQKGDLVYLFTDGYADQFGGSRKKKLKYSKFKELLFSIKDLPMNEQHEFLQDYFFDWKGHLSQIDDVCVMGIRL